GAGGGGWFALEGLVRRCRGEGWPLEEAQVRRVHRRAASWFESQDDLTRALLSLAEARDWRRLARLLRECGGELIASGHAAAVLRHSARLPPEFRDSGVEELLGDAHRILGVLESALEHLLPASGD